MQDWWPCSCPTWWCCEWIWVPSSVCLCFMRCGIARTLYLWCQSTMWKCKCWRGGEHPNQPINQQPNTTLATSATTYSAEATAATTRGAANSRHWWEAWRRRNSSFLSSRKKHISLVFISLIHPVAQIWTLILPSYSNGKRRRRKICSEIYLSGKAYGLLSARLHYWRNTRKRHQSDQKTTHRNISCISEIVCIARCIIMCEWRWHWQWFTWIHCWSMAAMNVAIPSGHLSRMVVPCTIVGVLAREVDTLLSILHLMEDPSSQHHWEDSEIKIEVSRPIMLATNS